MMEVSTEYVTIRTSLEPSGSVDVWKHLLSVLLAVTIPVAMFGNLLVLLAFATNKRVRRLNFNLYILNLALTDFTVSITALPLYFITFTLEEWPFGEFMCGLWIFLDWGMTFASIFGLVTISIDRFWAAQFSANYKQNSTRKRTILSICLMWVCIMIMWIPPFLVDRIRYSEPGVCVWAVENNREFTIFIAIMGYHGPSLVMIFCYIRVFTVMRQSHFRVATMHPTRVNTPSANLSNAANVRAVQTLDMSGSRSSSRNRLPGPASQCSSQIQRKPTSREYRIFISLTYIIVAYLICWAPFHIMFDIMYADETGTVVSTNCYAVGAWMCYLNSTINPILYAFGNPDFSRAFKNILTLKCLRGNAT